MTFRELLLLPENLVWAWRKARRLYDQADALYDQAEVAAFDLDLEAQLAQINRQFVRGAYQPRPLRLLPQPKRPDDSGKPRMRQSFQVAVRDQVAWIAVTNVLGPVIDRMMPPWSYGHRLYRAAWYQDTEEGNSRLSIGPYRHAQGSLYRNFRHSWPLFRRHVALTARKMATGRIESQELDKGDEQALKHALEPTNAADRIKYLEDGYWSQTEVRRDGHSIYYASLDLAKFYPSVSARAVLAGFDQWLPDLSSDNEMRSLISQMLEFKVITNGLSDTMLASIDPTTSGGDFDGIPTGLMVAGFLANVAMLPIDRAVEQQIHEHRNVAHFRFVDDHAILAFDFEHLCEWIRYYENLMLTHNVGVAIAQDKYDPIEMQHLIHATDRPLQNDEQAAMYETTKIKCKIDGRKPTKLLTRTLAQVSMLAATDFDTLTDPAKKQRLEQLEWLLLANIPETELRSDTRAAFAAGRISALAPVLFSIDPELIELSREASRYQKVNAKDLRGTEDRDKFEQKVADLTAEEGAQWRRHCAHYFSLLLQAFTEHPDKVRLLIRLIDYCRATGHDGLGELASWMKENATGNNYLLKRYLSALTLHALSRHLPRAANDLATPWLMHRQHLAAAEFIDHVASIDIDAFVDKQGILSRQPEFFQLDALMAFSTGLVAAATMLNQESESSLASRLSRLASRLFGLSWQSDSEKWNQATGHPIGVWVHWTDSLSSRNSMSPTPVWSAAAPQHDPYDKLDWNSLRRNPAALPPIAWDVLTSKPNLLAKDDGGWLLEAARSAPSRFARLKGGRAVGEVRRALSRRSPAYTTLVPWVNFTRALNDQDPRAGEWTSLAIVRQLIAPIFRFGGSLKLLDHIHHENALVPQVWLNDLTLRKSFTEKWTWENWKYVVTHEKGARWRKPYLNDFRFQSGVIDRSDGWASRLSSLGELLWGLLRKDFKTPTVWNIRGQERALIDLMRSDMEHLAISSTTLAILEACIVPRNQETLLMPMFPTLFGTNEPNDTLLDPPVIRSINEFDEALRRSQAVLERRQITVLNHQSRQIVPARVGQIARSGFSMEHEEGEL